MCLEPGERQRSEVNGDFEQVPWLSKSLTAMREAWKSAGVLAFGYVTTSSQLEPKKGKTHGVVWQLIVRANESSCGFQWELSPGRSPASLLYL